MARELELRQWGSLRYLLAAHEPPATGDRAALLCFLHGYEEGAPAPIEQALTRHGPLRPENVERVLREFVVVAPQLPLRGDLWLRYADDVRQVVEGERKRLSCDATRTYLTGFSYGGNGVVDIAAAQPAFWAALWAVDPTRVPSRDPLRPVWLSIGQVARLRKPTFVRALNLQPAGADSDRVYLDEGEDHVGCVTRAYADARIYSWLLSNRLGGERSK